jgi:hypothetical protein
VEVTPDELNDLARVVQKLLDEHRDRESHPEGARRVRLSMFAFPSAAPSESPEGTS